MLFFYKFVIIHTYEYLGQWNTREKGEIESENLRRKEWNGNVFAGKPRGDFHAQKKPFDGGVSRLFNKITQRVQPKVALFSLISNTT